MFPALAVSYYSNRKGLKAELGSDRLLGVPLETYIPSEKLAIESGSADENIEIMKAYMCKQRGIRLIKLPMKGTELDYANNLKKAFQSVHIFISSDTEEDVEIYRIWKENADKKSAQLVFCDLSTPKNDGTFSVYNDIRKKLIERGIPESEVKFIHEADTDMKKKELFQKTRKGEVRVLLGSTQKMGAGTNVQDKLIALHDVDCPWRPSDLEQRSGRIVRQGNENPQVDIYRYVTEQTFDAYLYQLVEGKQKFASQIMTSKSPVRSAEDIDETALSYAEIKMLATGNPYIKEKMDLDIQVQKLKMLKSNFLSEKYGLEDKVIKFYPQQIAYLKSRVEGLTKDVETAKLHPKPTDEQPLVHKCALHEKAMKGMKNSSPPPLHFLHIGIVFLSALPLRKISRWLPAFSENQSALGCLLPQ